MAEGVPRNIIESRLAAGLLQTQPQILLHDPQKETISYARVKVPAVLKQWVPVESDQQGRIFVAS